MIGWFWVIIPVSIAFLIFAWRVAIRSHEVDGEIFTNQLSANVNVFRNRYDIPNVTAHSESDMFFALGYVHAQDRLWQMDMMRRSGQGRLAEVLGVDESIRADKFLRALEIESIAEKNWKALSSTSKKILRDYSKGVNAYINHNGGHFAVEFDALGYTPEEWKPQDCLIVLRMMAFQMSFSFWSDLAFGQIAEKLGPELALDLVPGFPTNTPAVCDTGYYIEKHPRAIDSTILLSDATKHFSPVLPHWENSSHADRRIRQSLAQSWARLSGAWLNARAVLGMDNSGVGSNCWAMRKTINKSDGAILANDPHLPLGLPAWWYQVQMSCSTFHASGLTVPGLPLIAIGRNENVAWGFTNMMADDVDFFIEKTDSSNSDYFHNADGVRKRFTFVVDTIKVRGKNSVLYYQRRSERSVIVSDVDVTSMPALLSEEIRDRTRTFEQRYALSFRWTGQFNSDEILAMYRINKSTSWIEFTNALDSWGSPALNFTYADGKGNIGVAPSGFIPKRNECNPNIPNPGWMANYKWLDLHKSNELPRLYNPQKRFVFSANNITTRADHFFISSLWEPPSRSQRIAELLSQFEGYTSRKAQAMQMDQYSPHAKQILEVILPILYQREKGMTETERGCIYLMQKWDGVIGAQSSPGAIFNVFYKTLCEKTFRDELGDQLFLDYAFVTALPIRKMTELLVDTSSSPWFDDVGTVVTSEVKADIVFASFKETVKQLQAYFPDHSENPRAWKWGVLHSLELKHRFGREAFFKKIVNSDRLPFGGNTTTLNKGEWSFSRDFRPVVGASTRFVADMRDSIFYTIIPGGVSGQPMSPHYLDQYQLWINGGFVAQKFTREMMPNERLSLILH